MEDHYDQDELDFEDEPKNKKRINYLDIFWMFAFLLVFATAIYSGIKESNDTRAKHEEAQQEIVKCIEGGKRSEDCKTLADIKYFGTWK